MSLPETSPLEMPRFFVWYLEQCNFCLSTTSKEPLFFSVLFSILSLHFIPALLI